MTDGAEPPVTARGAYRAVLTLRYARPLLVWSLVARLPLGMTPIALLLLARGEGASYGAAGAITAAYGTSLGIGAPIAGHLVDRRGPGRVLLRRAVLYPTTLGLVLALALLDAPLLALGVGAAAAGLLLPPVAPTVRTVWPALAPDGFRSTVYSIEAALQEVFFVVGPLLVAVLASIDPLAGVAGAAIAAAVGTGALAGLRPIREAPPSRAGGRSLAGALESAGMRLIVAYAFATGLTFGALEVGMPAFAESHGSRELGAVGLGFFSAGSLVGGLLAGARPTLDYDRRLRLLAPVVPAAMALVALSWSIPSMYLLAFVAGLPLAPVIAAVYGLIDRVAPSWAIAEAFAWFGMAISFGMALGTATGGLVVDHLGVRGPFVLAPLVGGAGTVLVLARRHVLAPAPAG